MNFGKKKTGILLILVLSIVLMFSCNCLAGLENETAKQSSTEMVTPAQENIDSASEKTLRVNLNTANLEQLAELPGIGNSIAERIIKYRTETGLFKATDDLLSVKGIGKKKYEKLSGLITVQ